MKNKTFRLLKLFGLAVFATCVLFASCEMFTPPDTGNTPQDISRSERAIELDRREELALLHSAESHVNSEAELRNMVSVLLSSDTRLPGRSRSTVSGVYSYSVTIADGFSSVPANRRRETAEKEESTITFYVFYLDDQGEQGFAFTCADSRIRNLLALVPNGDFHDTENPFWQIFLSCLDLYIYETIDIYNSITDQDIAAVRERTGAKGARFITDLSGYALEEPIVKPLLTTQWDQDGLSYSGAHYPYNRIINILASNLDENLWPSGCVAVAMAQIAAYHQFPEKPPNSMRKPNTTTSVSGFNDPYNVNTYTAFSSISYNWDRMKYRYLSGKREEAPNANNLPPEYQMHVGVLMLEMGHRVNMKYDSDGSAPRSYDAYTVRSAFADMGYTSSPRIAYNIGDIKASLDKGRPVYISGYDFESGHAWVIDGYRAAWKGDIQYDFVHCNAGWSGSKDG